MAYGDGGEGGGGKELFEPFNSGEVEVVGGLVEEHDVRLDDHGLDDGEALAPATGEGGCLGVEVGKAGAAGEFAESAFAFGFVDVSGGEGLLKDLADREAVGKAGILGNVGGAGTLADGKVAGVGLDLAGEKGEEGGFAGAIGADEADAVAVFDGEGDVFEEGESAELLGHGLCVEDGGHLSLGYRAGARPEAGA